MGGNVDQEKSMDQWQSIVDAYIHNTETVNIVNYENFSPLQPATSKLPDSVFCANHGFPLDSDTILLSNMKYDERKDEIKYAKKMFEKLGYEVKNPQNHHIFEGQGDAKWDLTQDKIWMGYGQRSDKVIASQIKKETDKEVLTVKLNSEKYYHLDLCFEPLSEDTALLLEEAFNESDQEKFYDHYSSIISVPESDIKTMGGNSARICDNTVVVDKRNKQTRDKLNNNGFDTITVDTGEFMKGGGSVDCMQLRLF